jgi:hypothetical protein
MMIYKLYNKGSLIRHIVMDDGSEIQVPPSTEVELTKDQYQSSRVQSLISDFDSPIIDKSYEEKSNDKNLDEESNSDSDNLSEKDRSKLLSIASDLNYNEKTDKKIKSAKKDELIEFINRER